MPAAIPLVASGISAGVGAWNAHKQRKQQQKQAAQDQAMMQPILDSQTGIAQSTMRTGQSLVDGGMPQLQQAGNYYQNLLSGSRSGMTAALAPEISATTDVYKGAERNLERSGVQGAQRDMAKAELGREQAGKISGMIQGVRPGAASALAGLGGSMVTAGVGAMGSAGSVYANLLQGLNAMQDNRLNERKYGDQRSDALWGNIGKLLTDSYKAWNDRGGGGHASSGGG
jgi:hypothetical protein